MKNDRARCTRDNHYRAKPTTDAARTPPLVNQWRARANPRRKGVHVCPRPTGHRDHYRTIALLGATDGYPSVSGAVTPLKRPLPMSVEAQFVTGGVRTCVLGFESRNSTN